jgi:hypothetical protein
MELGVTGSRLLEDDDAYPGRAPPKLFWWVGAATLAAVAFGLTIPGILWDRERAMRDYRNWRLEGPPCPVLAEGPDPAPLRRTLVLAGTGFSRQYGNITCTLLHEAEGRGAGLFPVCQFTSPGQIRITGAGPAIAFSPGPGRSATVHLRGGRPVCVTSANPVLFDFTRDKPFSR